MKYKIACNVNLKNFARLYFCMLIIVLVVILMLGGSAGILAALMEG